MRNRHHTIYIVVPALIIIFIVGTAIVPTRILAAEESSFPAKFQDDFGEKFREGRDLMDKENWTDAAGIFLELNNKYPTHKAADAALYWLAFCYKKAGKLKEAEPPLSRLLKDFPDSLWGSDAKVLQLEIKKLIEDYERSAKAYEKSEKVFKESEKSYLRSGQIYKESEKSYETSQKSYGRSAKSYEESAKSYEKLAKNFPTSPTFSTFDGSSDSPLERDDEIRLAAFQNLLGVDPKRAIEMTGELLNPDSKAGESLKRNMLRSLRNHRFQYSKNNQNILQLHDVLMNGYRNESDIKIRAEIIYSLIDLNDGTSNDDVLQLYRREQNTELKKVIINSFNGLNFFSPDTAANLTIFSPAKSGKLLEIFRTEKETELRILALSNLKRFSKWSAQIGVLDTLVRIYDSENDEELRLEIIRSLALVKENRALTKLMSIAEYDKNDTMRREAIRILQADKRPEIIKFLKELTR